MSMKQLKQFYFVVIWVFSNSMIFSFIPSIILMSFKVISNNNNIPNKAYLIKPHSFIHKF